MKLAYYPGCSMEGSARMYEQSLYKVLNLLGVELEEIPDWNCCGASSAHRLPIDQATALATRNLVKAQAMGMDLFTGCAACFFRLKSAHEVMMHSPHIAGRVNSYLPETYKGNLNIYSLLDILCIKLDEPESIPPVRRQLEKLNPACYYGCLFMRAPGKTLCTSPANPQVMEKALQHVGIEPVDWSFKTECCGASSILTQPETTIKLINGIIQDAVDNGANAIVTACPLCQLNLELGQRPANRLTRIAHELPVLFITQVLGLAWGFTEKEMEVERLIAGRKSLAGALK